MGTPISHKLSYGLKGKRIKTEIILWLGWWFCFVLLGLGFKLRASHTCRPGALPLEPHLQSILLWLFWRWSLENYLLGWPQTMILLISASQVARIPGVSHWHLAVGLCWGIVFLVGLINIQLKHRKMHKYILLLLILLLSYYRYIVTFTKVLTVYHSWIYPLRQFPLSSFPYS
jgi:hypothetical protein